MLFSVFLTHGIAPHFFQLIKFPGFRQHDMDHHIYIIDQHPLQVLVAFMMIWILTTLLPHFILHVFGYSPDLGLVAGFTDNKEISNSFIDFAEIERNNVSAFFLLDSRNDGFDDF